jgi:hypothetical protein
MPKQSRRANRLTKKTKKTKTFSKKEKDSFSKYKLLKQKNDKALVSYTEMYHSLKDSEENNKRKVSLVIAIKKFKHVNYLIGLLNTFYTGEISPDQMDTIVKNCVYTETDRNLCKIYIDVVQSEGKLFIYHFNKNMDKFLQYYSKVKQGQSSFLNTLMFEDISDSNIELPVGRNHKLMPLHCDEYVRMYAKRMKSFDNLI